MSHEPSREPSERTGLTRREAVGAIAATLTCASLSVGTTPTARRPRIAAVVTEYRKMTHGQGIVDRFLDGYGSEGGHHRPAVDVVSLYVDQRPKGDLTDERLARHPGLRAYSTIAEALTCGNNQLQVDGVMLIAEQGKYPVNDRGQRQYPRYEFFKQVVEVFRRTGRSVPVFNDKHLSWKWEWARSMYDQARTLGFPFLAGSSLPVTWRIPSVDVALEADLEEIVCVGYGGLDSYDFHGLETLQCLAERRRGGESGVAAVRAIKGKSVWDALGSGSWAKGGCDLGLFESCLSRSFTLASPRKGYGHVLPEQAQMPALARNPFMFRIEYRDGFKATLLMLSGLVHDFTVAVRDKGTGDVLSTQMYLPGLAPGHTMPNFFSALANQIETMFLTGKPPYPVERTLLTTGILASAIDSLARGQVRLETPHLGDIAYQPSDQSNFMRS